MKHGPLLVLFPLLLLAMLPLQGCASYRSLKIEPVDSKGVVIQPRFKEAYYRVDRDRVLTFVARNRGPDQATHQLVDQVLVVRMFWIPHGGKTTMNEKALNATFRYIVMSPTAVGMYEGAGFVRLSKKVGKVHLTARIVDGDLRLTESSGDFNDNLGKARVAGNFVVKLSNVKAFDMAAEAHREFFRRSLALAAAKAATQPGGSDTTNPSESEPATQPANANTQPVVIP